MEKIWYVVLFGLMTGCVSTEEVDDALAVYVGKNVKEVVEELGTPSNIYNMQNGTWHYIWTEKSDFSKGIGTTFMGVPLSKKTLGECTKVLVVDKQKSVVDYAIEGKC